MTEQPQEAKTWWLVMVDNLSTYLKGKMVDDVIPEIKDFTVQAVQESHRRGVEEGRREMAEEMTTWCEVQMKRWVENNSHTCFRSGVRSGYAWMKDHIDHGDGECRCPGRSSLKSLEK